MNEASSSAGIKRDEQGPLTRQQKKRKAEAESSTAQPSTVRQDDKPANCGLNLSLLIRWYSPSGKTKVNRVMLRPINGICGLEGITKSLVQRAFPESSRPDYLTSEAFYKFTPTEEFMSLPGEVFRTEFRLVAHHGPWEYTILEHELGAQRDHERNLLVTAIEYGSTSLLLIGQLGLRVSLISYPVVSVKKAFLDRVACELETNPDFTGIL